MSETLVWTSMRQGEGQAESMILVRYAMHWASKMTGQQLKTEREKMMRRRKQIAGLQLTGEYGDIYRTAQSQIAPLSDSIV